MGRLIFVLLSNVNDCDWCEFEANSLQSLKQKIKETYNVNVEKFLRESDLIEIDDEEVFQELLNDSQSEKLYLIAVNNCQYSNSLITKELELKKKKLADQIKKEKNEIKNLENILQQLDLSENENKMKLKEINQEYKFLALQTISTKPIDQSHINNLEIRFNQIKKKHNIYTQLINDINKIEIVDFCFLLDCTGSMSTYIDEVISISNQIVDDLINDFKNLKIRFAFVGYRDYGDEERLLSSPFIEQLDLFQMILSRVEARGGQDECEDVLGGLFKVTQLDWSNRTRILFHICDAPCHGKRFHENCEDFYPDGDPNGMNIKQILDKLNQLEINYFFAEVNSKTRKMIQEFNKESRNGNQIKCLDLNECKNLKKLVEESICTTLIQATRTLVGKRKIKERKINPILPDWTNLRLFKKYKADFFSVKYLDRFSRIKSKFIDYEKTKCEIWIYEEPFSRGALRYAYASVLNLGDDKEDTNCLLNCVVKESIFNDASYKSKQYYEESLRVQLIAGYLAYKFRQIYPSDTKLRYLSVDLIQVHETGAYYTIEEFVEGIFKKWMNNEGNVNELEYVELLNAFSHWTYQFTNEYLIVTDLQGFVYKQRDFVLTDPAILCSEENDKFGSTNLGLDGIKNFFLNHKCNKVCQKLKLKKNMYQN